MIFKFFTRRFPRPGVAASFLLLVCGLLLPPSTAFAIQTHAAPEGLYVHQVGHIVYTIAMAGLAYGIWKSELNTKPGWRLLSWGAVLLAVWNIWAFCGHIVEVSIPADHFAGEIAHRNKVVLMKTWLDYCYFILKMDHFVCVPALIFFYLGLKRMQSHSARHPSEKQEVE